VFNGPPVLEQCTQIFSVRALRLLMLTAAYGFGDTRAFKLTLLIFTPLSGWCSSGVVITKFSGHAVTFRIVEMLCSSQPQFSRSPPRESGPLE
jgi:hypothetical protein